MLKIFTFIFAVFLVSCNHPHYKEPHIVIYTNYGDIELELYPDKAPKTVAAFLSYIDKGYYTNGLFYRVVKIEGMSGVNYGFIQGGIWQTDEKQHPLIPGIPHETTRQSGLSHVSGTISLARTTPGSANTEFFICVGDQGQFDYGTNGAGDGQGFAAFGKVFKGMDVVRKIQEQKSRGEIFVEKINIEKIKRF